MKKVDFRQIESSLRNRRATGGARGADAFWGDFRARARMVPQQTAVTAGRGARVWGWSVAFAGAAAVALLVFLLPVAAPAGNRIDALEVMGDYSGVFILDDGGEAGTIVWISGLNGNGAD